MTIPMTEMMQALIERGLVERPGDASPRRPNRLVYTPTYNAYRSAFELLPNREPQDAQLDRRAAGDQRTTGA